MTILRALAIIFVTLVMLEVTGVVDAGLRFGSQSLVSTEPEDPVFVADTTAEVAIGLYFDNQVRPGFLEGAQLAVSEINADGGLLGRRLTLIEIDEADQTWREAARNLPAHRLLEVTTTLAIIGHSKPSYVVRARAHSERLGILHVNALTSESLVGRPNQTLSFSTLPDHNMLGEEIAVELAQNGAGRIALFSNRSRAGLEVSQAIKDAVAPLDVSVVFQKSRASSDGGYIEDLSTIMDLNVDTAVFLFDFPEERVLLSQAAFLDLKTSIYLVHPDTIFAPERDLPVDKLSVFVPDLWHQNGVAAEYQEQFQTALSRSSNVPGTIWAAQGYDAIHVVADAANLIESLDPAVIASVLRTATAYNGPTGLHQFDETGAITSKTLSFTRVSATGTEGDSSPVHQ